MKAITVFRDDLFLQTSYLRDALNPKLEKLMSAFRMKASELYFDELTSTRGELNVFDVPFTCR